MPSEVVGCGMTPSTNRHPRACHRAQRHATRGAQRLYVRYADVRLASSHGESNLWEKLCEGVDQVETAGPGAGTRLRARGGEPWLVAECNVLKPLDCRAPEKGGRGWPLRWK
jgi:hypothetical protein